MASGARLSSQPSLPADTAIILWFQLAELHRGENENCFVLRGDEEAPWKFGCQPLARDWRKLSDFPLDECCLRAADLMCSSEKEIKYLENVSTMSMLMALKIPAHFLELLSICLSLTRRRRRHVNSLSMSSLLKLFAFSSELTKRFKFRENERENGEKKRS